MNFSDDLKKKLESLEPENFKMESEIIEKEIFLEEKKSRLKEFFKEFSHSKFSEQNDIFKRLEIFIKLVTFDFKTLLYYFTKDYSISTEAGKSGIKFFIADELLEKLAVAVNALDFDYSTINFIEEMKTYSVNFPIVEKNNTIFFTDSEIAVIKRYLIRYLFLKIKSLCWKSFNISGKTCFSGFQSLTFSTTS